MMGLYSLRSEPAYKLKRGFKRATCLNPLHRRPVFTKKNTVLSIYFLSLVVVQKTVETEGPRYFMGLARADFLRPQEGLLCRRTLSKIDLYEA